MARMKNMLVGIVCVGRAIIKQIANVCNVRQVQPSTSKHYYVSQYASRMKHMLMANVSVWKGIT